MIFATRGKKHRKYRQKTPIHYFLFAPTVSKNVKAKPICRFLAAIRMRKKCVVRWLQDDKGARSGILGNNKTYLRHRPKLYNSAPAPDVCLDERKRRWSLRVVQESKVVTCTKPGRYQCFGHFRGLKLCYHFTRFLAI